MLLDAANESEADASEVACAGTTDEHCPVGNIAHALRQAQRRRTSTSTGNVSAVIESLPDVDRDDSRGIASTVLRVEGMLALLAAGGISYGEDASAKAGLSSQTLLQRGERDSESSRGCGVERPASRAFVPAPPGVPRMHVAYSRTSRSQFFTGETADDVVQCRASACSGTFTSPSEFYTGSAVEELSEGADRLISSTSMPPPAASSLQEALVAVAAPTEPSSERAYALRRSRFANCPKAPDVREVMPNAIVASESHDRGSKEEFYTVQRCSREHFFTAENQGAPAHVEKVVFEEFKPCDRLPKERFYTTDARSLFAHSERVLAVSKEQYKTAERGLREQFYTAEALPPILCPRGKTMVAKDQFKTGEGVLMDQYITAEAQNPVLKNQALVSKEQFQTAERVGKDRFYTAEARQPTSLSEGRSLVSKEHFRIAEVGSMEEAIVDNTNSQILHGLFDVREKGTDESVERLVYASVSSCLMVSEEGGEFALCERGDDARMSFAGPASARRPAPSTGDKAMSADEPERVSFDHPAAFARQAAGSKAVIPPPAERPMRRSRIMSFAALPAAANGVRAALMSANAFFEVARSVIESED